MNNTLKKSVSIASKSNHSIRNSIKKIFSKKQVNVNEVNVKDVNVNEVNNNELKYFNYDDHIFTVDVDNEIEYNLSINNINNINKLFSKLVDKNNFIKKYLLLEEINSVEDFSSILNKYLRITNFDKNTVIALHDNIPMFLYHEEFPEFILKDINTLPYYYKASISNFVNYRKNVIEDFINSDENIKQQVDIFLYKRHPDSSIEPHISLNTFMRNPLDKTKVISIDSTYPINLDLITDKLPKEINGYLNFLNTEMEGFLNSIEINDVITLEYGNNTEISNLKILSSPLYPEWQNNYISEIKINGSNEQPSKIFQNLLSELNSKFSSLEENELTISILNIKDDKFLFYNKLIPGDEKPILLCKYFEISTIAAPINKIIGDSQIDGNILVGKDKDNYLLKTNSVDNSTLISTKVGINQKNYEVNALLDIDNLTNEKLVNALQDFNENLILSHTISKQLVEYTIDNYNIVDNEIVNLFKNSDPYAPIPVFSSVSQQCYVIKCPLNTTISMSDIILLNSPESDPLQLNTIYASFLELIQRNVNELLQMKEYIFSLNDQREMFSYFELLATPSLNYFLLSMKCIVQSETEVLFIITFKNIDSIMNDPSYITNATIFFNYLSSFNRFGNFVIMLIKNAHTQSLLLTTYDSQNLITKVIDENPYFFNRLGLINTNDFFMYESGFTIDSIDENIIYATRPKTAAKTNKKFIFVESIPEWNGKYDNEFWNKEINLSDITDAIDIYYDTNYGKDKVNGWFPITYKFNGKREISVAYRTVIDGKIYTIGSGDEINKIITKGISLKSDAIIDGDLDIRDGEDNVIFKVDNIDKKITNAYKVGIGMDYPKSILDIKDITLYKYKQFALKGVEQRYNIVRIVEKLRESFLEYSSEGIPSYNENNIIDYKDVFYNEAPNQDYSNYFVLLKINPTILLSEEATIMYHYSYSDLEYKKINNVKPSLRNVMQLHNFNVNKILKDTPIFDGSYGQRIGEGIAGPKRYRYEFFIKNNNYYCLITGVNLNEYNLRFISNDNSKNTINASTAMTDYSIDIYRQVKNITTNSILNYDEYKENQALSERKTENIFFDFYKLELNRLDIYESRLSRYNPNNINDIQSSILLKQLATITLSTNDKDDVYNIISFVKTIKLEEIKEKCAYGSLYEGKKELYVSSFIIDTITDTNITLYMVQFSPSTLLIPSLNVVGDSNITGNSTVTNEETGNAYLSVDPSKKTIMVNSDREYINYGNIQYSTTNKFYGSKNNMLVANDSYPNFVCERTAEQVGNNELISTYTASTMKRKSNLYTLEQIKSKNDVLLEKYKDTDYKPKYGPDISFEVEDKTNNTIEIGQVAMTVDDVDDNGNIKGGFGVYTNTSNGDGNFESSRKTILYVDNEGTLEVKKIKLAGKDIIVDENGNLKIA